MVFVECNAAGRTRPDTLLVLVREEVAVANMRKRSIAGSVCTTSAGSRHSRMQPASVSAGSVAKSGYLVTCLRDLPRGVEA